MRSAAHLLRLICFICLCQIAHGFTPPSSSQLNLHKTQRPKQPRMASFIQNAKDEGGEHQEEEDKEFKPNKPIDLPSLNPTDAGPMYATCRSVTGVEPSYAEDDGDENVPLMDPMKDFEPNQPIELESLPKPTFLGLEPKEDNLRMRDGSMVDSGLPMFTSTIITLISCYFIYLGFSGGDISVVDMQSSSGSIFYN